MPAENFHAGSQAPQPGERVTASGIILPAEVGRERNIKETIQVEASTQRATKYNTPGVDFDDPYNYFYQEKATKSPEAPNETQLDTHDKVLEHVAGSIEDVEKENEDQTRRISELEDLVEKQNDRINELKKAIEDIAAQKAKAPEEAVVEQPLADKQPRRVRSLEDGTIQRLVKNADGSFDWATIEKSTSSHDADKAEAKQGEAAQQAAVAPEAASPEAVTPESTPETPQGADAPVVGKELVTVASQELERTTGTELEPYKYPTAEIPAELLEALDEARDRYAQETANKRNSYVGHYLRNSKYLAKIPFLKAAADALNERKDAPVEDARVQYQQVIAHVQAEVQRQYEEMSDEAMRSTESYQKALKMSKMMVAIQSQPLLEAKICSERQAQSGKSNKFVDWWVSREGLKGKLAKALVVGGTGVALGVASSLLAIPAAGAFIGGAAGLGIAQHVTKRRANGVVKSEGVTLAESQMRQSLRDQHDFILSTKDEQDTPNVRTEDLTRMVDDRTAAETQGNRARLRTAGAIGFAGGGLGAGATEVIKNLSDAQTPTGSAETQPPADATNPTGNEASVTNPPLVETPPTPELLGNSFDIQQGSGFTQEILDFTAANGHTLQPQQAFELHNELLNNFGTYIQNATGNPVDTYMQGTELRISAPGSGQWAPGVSNYIQNWMTARGL